MFLPAQQIKLLLSIACMDLLERFHIIMMEARQCDRQGP